jgi:hypothetical protein
MKPRQLANILIKILGFYIILSAIPGVINGIVSMVTMYAAMNGAAAQRFVGFGAYALGYAVQGLVGVLIFFKSRTLSEFWFKNEDE